MLGKCPWSVLSWAEVVGRTFVEGCFVYYYGWGVLVRGWDAVGLIPLTEPWVKILVGDGCFGSVGLLEGFDKVGVIGQCLRIGVGNGDPIFS